jgi:hypothetical protein
VWECRLDYFVQVAVFWIALSSLVEVYRRFRGACCLSNQAIALVVYLHWAPWEPQITLDYCSLGQGQIARFYDHVVKSWRFVKGEELFIKLSNCQLLKKDFAAWRNNVTTEQVEKLTKQRLYTGLVTHIQYRRHLIAKCRETPTEKSRFSGSAKNFATRRFNTDRVSGSLTIR